MQKVDKCNRPDILRRFLAKVEQLEAIGIKITNKENAIEQICKGEVTYDELYYF